MINDDLCGGHRAGSFVEHGRDLDSPDLSSVNRPALGVFDVVLTLGHGDGWSRVVALLHIVSIPGVFVLLRVVLERSAPGDGILNKLDRELVEIVGVDRRQLDDRWPRLRNTT